MSLGQPSLYTEFQGSQSNTVKIWRVEGTKSHSHPTNFMIEMMTKELVDSLQSSVVIITDTRVVCIGN